MEVVEHQWRDRLAEMIAEADPALEARMEHADTGAALAFVGVSANLSAEADGLLRSAVTAARRLGGSWGSVGAQLGVTRQAAQQRFAAPRQVLENPSEVQADARHQFATPPQVGDRRVVTGATAFNELEILQREGAAGWKLEGGGGLFLEFSYAGVAMEHQRVSSNRGRLTRKRAEEDMWTYCFSWVFFHFFSRPMHVKESQ
jgi:hypothetical protein